MDSLKDQRISNSIISNMKKSRSMNSTERSLNVSASRLLDKHLEFVPASSSSLQHNSLKSKYKPINSTSPQNKQESNEINKNKAIIEICPSDKIDLCWPASCNKVASGMKNLGNTCFLNSTLQCLLHTPPLYNYLVSKYHRCQLNTFCMACALKNLMTIAFSSNDQTSPTFILQNLRFIAKHMKWGRQEDAHEFLRYVIDALHQTDLIGYEKLDASSKETTMPYQIFAGYLKSIVLCLKCNNKSEKLDPFLDICLDIQNVQDVIAGLKKFVSPDMLGGDNMYHCLHCKSKTNAQKYFKFHKLPNVFTIQLKRYLMNGNKISRHVSFPEVLNLSPFMLPEKESNTSNTNTSNTYKLYSVLVHEGSSRNSGHYYCYVRGPNNLWYCMNDSNVSQTSLQNILRAQAYILFYLRECTSKRGQNDSTYNKSFLNTMPSKLNNTFSMQINSGNQKPSTNCLNQFVCSKYIPNSSTIKHQSNQICFNKADNIKMPSLNSSRIIQNSKIYLDSCSLIDSNNLTNQCSNLLQNNKNIPSKVESTLSNKENLVDNISKQNTKDILNTGAHQLEVKTNLGSQIKINKSGSEMKEIGSLNNHDLTISDSLKVSPIIKKRLGINDHNISIINTQIFKSIKNDDSENKHFLMETFKNKSSLNQDLLLDKKKFKILDNKKEIDKETNIDELKKQNSQKFKNSNLMFEESSNIVKKDLKMKDLKSETKTAAKLTILNSPDNKSLIFEKNCSQFLKPINKINESYNLMKMDCQESPIKLQKIDESIIRMPNFNLSGQSDIKDNISTKKRKSIHDSNIEYLLDQKKKLRIGNENIEQTNSFEKIHKELSHISLNKSTDGSKKVKNEDDLLNNPKLILKKNLKKSKLNNNGDILKNQSLTALRNNTFDVVNLTDEIKILKNDNSIFQNDKADPLKNSLCNDKKLPVKLNEGFSNYKIKRKEHNLKDKQKNKLKKHDFNIFLENQKINNINNKNFSENSFYMSTPIQINSKRFMKLSNSKKQRLLRKLTKLNMRHKKVVANNGVNSLTQWRVINLPIHKETDFSEIIKEKVNFKNGSKKMKDFNKPQNSIKSECPTLKWDTNVSINYKSFPFNENSISHKNNIILGRNAKKDTNLANFLKEQSSVFGCEVKTWNDQLNSFDALSEQEQKLLKKRMKFDDLDEEIDQGRTKKKKVPTATLR